MSSFLSKIGGAVKHVAVVVSHAFEAVFGKQAAEDFGKAALEVLKSEAGKIALDAVESMQAVTPAMNGSAKRAQAFTKISADLKAAGQDVPTSLVNLLIELAVNAISGYISVSASELPAAPEPQAQPSQPSQAPSQPQQSSSAAPAAPSEVSHA